MTFDSTSAGRADLEFTATTGPAKSGILDLRATFGAATRGMSDDALKLAAAQERLDAALVRSHGTVTRSTLAAELNLRSLTTANETTVASSDAAATAFRREGTEIERLGRGAAVGSGLVRGLGRAAAFSSTAFLGGAGLTFAIRDFTKAAQEHQAVEAQLAAALKAQGVNYATYKAQIDDTLRSQEELSGFTEDETAASFTKLFRATGSVTEALKLNSTAASIARGSGNDLATVANAVAKAYDGQTGSLRRLVPSIQAGVKGQQALDQASQQFSGALAANADTAAGAQQRLAIAIHQTEISIGEALLPTVKRLETELTTWLDKTSNQKRIQDDVNTAISDGTKIVQGLVDAEKLIAPPIQAVIGALGGLEHAVELALVTGLALKAKSAASSMGLIQTASLRARTQIANDSAAEVKSLALVADEAATASGVVSRVGAYTGAGAIAGGAAGGVGLAALLKRGASNPALLLAALVGSSYLPAGAASSNLQGALTAGLTGSIVAGPAGGLIAAGGYETAKGGVALSNYLGSTHLGKTLGIGNTGRLSPQDLLKLGQAVQAGKVSDSQLESFLKLGGITGTQYQILETLAAGPPQSSPFDIAKGAAGAVGATVPAAARGAAGSLQAGKQKLLALAESAIGTPYLWGGSSPGGFDCSGLVMWAFANGLNINIPRTTYGQATTGALIGDNTLKGATPGDVIFTQYGEGGKAGPGHEGIYVGNGQVLAAPHTGAKVGITSLAAFTSGGHYTVRDLTGPAGATAGSQLTPAQQRAISLAGNPTLAALQAEDTYDKNALAFVNKRLAAGKITAKAYVAAVTQIRNDEASTESQIQSLESGGLSKAKKTADAAAARLHAGLHFPSYLSGTAADAIATRPLLTKELNRAEISGTIASTIAARRLVLDQQLRHRVTGSFQQTFTIPLALQVAEARAGTTATTKDDIRVAEEIKKFAETSIVVNKLRGQALIDALNAITAANSVIGTQAKASSPASVSQSEAQFLSSAQAIIGSYAPNYTDGKAATHLYELVHETRKTNQHLAEIKKTSKFPGTYGSKLALEAALG